MCKVKSGLVLRDRVYVPDHDSHDLMLKELGIEDDYLGASEKFVRFELSPKDGNLLDDVENWVLKIDQDIVPDWFDVEEKRIVIVNAVRVWAEVHIITSGEHGIEDGIYYLFGKAKATLRYNAQATLRENAKATLWDNAKATLSDNAKATLWDNAQATLWDNAQATLWDNAKVSNCEIHDCAIVINHEEHKVWTASKWENEVI